MTQRLPGWFFKVTWWVVAPVLLFIMLLFVLIGYQDVTYGSYIYPEWAILMGWAIAVASIIPLPIVAVFVVYKTPGDTLAQKFKNSIQSPLKEKSMEKRKLDIAIYESKEIVVKF